MGTIELGSRLSSGDTGTVYHATDHGEPVAVKLLHEHLAADPIVRSRFLREGRTLAAVRHAHIVRVFDVTEIDDRPAMVMELLTGGDMCGRILPPDDAMRLLVSLAGALGEIHKRGIVHRDLRPEHVLFDDKGSPRITDFGMASLKDLSGLTRSTVYATRPGYADPYTWGRGQSLPTQDIYGLGCIVFAALTGKPPSGSAFTLLSESELENRSQSLEEKAGHPLSEIVSSMIGPPEHRPRTAAEIIEWTRSRQRSSARVMSECLYCGKPMPKVAPLCLSCGAPPVQIRLDPDGEYIALRKINEKQEVLQPFLKKLRTLSDEPIGEVKFIIGDARLYSRAEQKSGVQLPVRIADDLHPSSVEPLMKILGDGSQSEIRLSRHPMSRRKRVKRGPLIRSKQGRIVPPETLKNVAGLVESTRDQHDLRSQCRYSVAIAAARLASDPATRHLADAEHVSLLWKRLDEAAAALTEIFTLLAGTNLQSAYADLERLELQSSRSGSAARKKEHERLVGLFAEHGESERRAAELQQRIVTACEILESIEPATAPEQLAEIEDLLVEPR